MFHRQVGHLFTRDNLSKTSETFFVQSNTSKIPRTGTCYNDTQFARFEEITVKPARFFERNAQFVCDAFNLKGVSLSVDTACAASFSALHQAVQAFQSNEIDRMIIGALSINQKPSTTLGFSNLRMLSAEGKGKCLDAKVDGYCRSEAIVSLFLQRRKEAKRYSFKQLVCSKFLTLNSELSRRSLSCLGIEK